VAKVSRLLLTSSKPRVTNSWQTFYFDGCGNLVRAGDKAQYREIRKYIQQEWRDTRQWSTFVCVLCMPHRISLPFYTRAVDLTELCILSCTDGL
jgi:hypothetical protein